MQLTEDGYERHYLHLALNDIVYGLACLNYDSSNLGGHRCYIRHLSTISAKHLKQGLQAVIDYIWREIQCDDIRVEIYHFKNQDGAINVDPHVKTVYTQ